MKISKRMIAVGSLVALAGLVALPVVARGNQDVCAPMDTDTGCTCNENGYYEEYLLPESTGVMEGSVAPGDTLVSQTHGGE